MDSKSNQNARDRTRVSGLASDEMYIAPMSESPFTLVDSTRMSEAVSGAPPVDGSLPARRIELRYWLGALALGTVMWVAILEWL